MGTEVLANAKKFVAATDGMSRAQEIDWFRREFGVDELSLLRLLGYRPADVAKQKAEGATFETLAEARPEQTVWVSELVRGLVDRFGYDMASLAESLGPLLPEHTRPGAAGLTSPLRRLSDAALVREIQTGGPDVVHHLAEYVRRNPSSDRPLRRATPA